MQMTFRLRGQQKLSKSACVKALALVINLYARRWATEILLSLIGSAISFDNVKNVNGIPYQLVFVGV